MRRRTELAVPASSWRMIEKGAASQADLAFLDLEDAVAPSEKAAARGLIARAFAELDWGAKPRAYRINSVDSPWCHRDVIDVVEAARELVDVIILPKAESRDDVRFVSTLLDQLERSLGLARQIRLEVQIESPTALLNAVEIATASPRVHALIFGPGDFAASAGMPSAAIGARDEWDADYPGDRWHHVMSGMVMAARAAGVLAIDGPFADYRNPDGLRAASRRARALGYDGKWCIHPSQIDTVAEVFTPSPGEIAWAQIGRAHV